MSIIINPPDFEDMMGISEAIREMSLKEILLKNQIKEAETNVAIEAIKDSKHWVDGKQPSMSFINATWINTGFNGEISKLRNDLAMVSSTLEHLKRQFEIKKSMLEVWRTESANKRASVL